ncbi:hypothetical protein CDAR_548081 [Caerostris darwini]|uniref:Uncharacterized protein n=1 Tax=Caerostris darwini TaxID=1538125 RepID=A0AAV4WEG9_9ARAC|nr:hypothetical protein CDAR_548081 [Caerostris darwini]
MRSVQKSSALPFGRLPISIPKTCDMCSKSYFVEHLFYNSLHSPSLNSMERSHKRRSNFSFSVPDSFFTGVITKMEQLLQIE